LDKNLKHSFILKEKALKACLEQRKTYKLEEKNKIDNEDKHVRLSINSIRKHLYDEYTKYLPTYEGQIVDILMGQGKKSLITRVKSNLITFHDMIFSENYYLTTLDYWLLLTKWQISSFFISSKFLFDTKYNHNNLLVFDEKNPKDLFVFIVIPGVVNDIIPLYKVIINIKNSNNPFISLKELNNCDGRNDLMISIDEYNENKSADFYIKHYTREKKTVYKKKKPKLIMDESSESGEKNEKKENKQHKQNLDINIPSSSESFELTAPKKTKSKTATKKNVIKKVVSRQQNTKKNNKNNKLIIMEGGVELTNEEKHILKNYTSGESTFLNKILRKPLVTFGG
jgi:hypothetical protein